MSVDYHDDARQKQSFVFKQNASVRDRIIFDKESTETLIYMVKSAKNVLHSNHNYSTFHCMVAELVNALLEEDMLPSFFCGMDEEDRKDKRKRHVLVGKYIDHLLRFLAMQTLLNGSDYNSNRTDEFGNRMFQMNPSVAIRQCWKALMMLPVTYLDVCKSLGCDAIDYDDEEIDFLGEKSKSEWGRECYEWTIRTHTNLYIIPPSRKFWPVLEAPDLDINLLGICFKNI